MEFQFGFFPQVFLLVFFRTIAILIPIVIYGRVLVPAKIMVALGLLLALVLLPIVPPSWHQAAAGIQNIPQMLFALLNEILLGAVIGLTLNMMLAIALLGGTIAGWGSSLMMAQSIDPVTGAEDVILSEIVQNTLIMFFLLSNGHLLIIKMLAVSFQAVPPDFRWLQAGLMNRLIEMGAHMFQWGLRFGLPVMATVLLIDACMGLVSRMAPDFDILFLSFPIRLIAGLAVLGLTIRYGAGFFNNVIDMTLRQCAGFLM